MDSITTSQLQNWLNGFDNPGTRNTHRKRIVTLFRWSRKNGYLPKSATTEAEDTESAVEPPHQIGIIDGATLTACLNVIVERHKHYVPALVLAALCGLRRSEIHGQDWKDIHLDRRLMRVTAAKPGTAQNRMVPICDRAAYYFEQHCVQSGPVCGNLAIDRIGVEGLFRIRGKRVPYVRDSIVVGIKNVDSHVSGKRTVAVVVRGTNGDCGSV